MDFISLYSCIHHGGPLYFFSSDRKHLEHPSYMYHWEFFRGLFFVFLFFFSGRFHKSCMIQSCACEDIASACIRHNLWPSSPTKPKLVISFHLMDFLIYLMIEGHTSLQALCQSIRWKNGLSIHQVDCIQYLNYLHS